MHTDLPLIALPELVDPSTVILTLSARFCVERGFETVARRGPIGRWARACRVWAISLVVCPALGAAGGCSAEELLTLGRTAGQVSSGERDADVGDAEPPPRLPLVFDEPVLVEELYSAAQEDNPTLTWDMREIYFSSKRGGETTDLWWAHRENVADPFSEPVFLEEMSSPEFDTSPAIEGDGLTFWFSSAREDGQGDLDIIRVTRPTRSDPWGTPTLVAELNSELDDIPRPTGAKGRIMPMASRRAGNDYLTYFATRPSEEEAFTDVTLVAELTPTDALAADAFLTDDGLTILYARSVPEEPGDLYMATRTSLSEPFGQVLAIDSLNTEADERDPWLSPDGQTLYFASDRDGELAIYRAALR